MPGGQTSQEAKFSAQSQKEIFFSQLELEKTRPPALGSELPVCGFMSAEAGSVGNRAGGFLPSVGVEPLLCLRFFCVGLEGIDSQVDWELLEGLTRLDGGAAWIWFWSACLRDRDLNHCHHASQAPAPDCHLYPRSALLYHVADRAGGEEDFTPATMRERE